ncbi:MAG: tRNA (adenosine(37)-N6)-threonylcarbamoyltransferase complex transferase subunit TsaD [Chitinophagaceae bacterium]
MAVILGIESSCDDTSAAVCKDGKILSNFIATQKIHQEYGGVVPELASRAHIQNIVPVVDTALKKAGISKKDIDAIAFTQAPGLIGSLLVGAQFAKSMALALRVPLIAVHHMQAHVLANVIPSGDNDADPKPSFPFLCLTVSGGHTQIVLAHSPFQFEVLGQTIDDAAGEAFDKTAKLMGLPYPGGPLIDRYAKEGNPDAFTFAKPQIPDLDFSFSGLKTSVMYFLNREKQKDPDFVEKNKADLCASIQKTIIDILMKKLRKAVEQTGIGQVCIAGGVSANSGLRDALQQYGEQYGWSTFYPPFQYCTDNGGMIAMTGYYKFLENNFADMGVSPTARATW